MADDQTPQQDTTTPEHLDFNRWLASIDNLREEDMDFKSSILANHKSLYKAGSKELLTDFISYLDEIGFHEKWDEYERTHDGEKAVRPKYNLNKDLKAHLVSIGFEDAVETVENYQKRLQGVEGYENAPEPSQKQAAEIAIGYASSIMGAKGPFSRALLVWMMQDPARFMPEYYMNADGAEKEYDTLRGDMFEHFGQSLVYRDANMSLEDALAIRDGDIPEKYAGVEKATSDIFKKQNGEAKYLVKNANCEWEEISTDEVVSMLRDPNGPNVFFTSNHAFHENRADLTQVTDEMERLANESIRSAIGGEKVNHLTGYTPGSGQTLKNSDTVAVSFSHTRENNFLNLAQLFHRLDEVEQHKGQSLEDPMHNLPATSKLMCATILKAIVQDPDKVLTPNHTIGRTQLFDRSNPPKLRADADKILENAIYVGFSQGGNMMRDGMRFLTQELEALCPLGNKQEGAPDIREILASINMKVMSCNVKEFDQFYQDRGVYVPIISNVNDPIAPPAEFSQDTNEPKFDVIGEEGGKAHHPVFKVSTLLAVEDTKRLFRGAFARCSGNGAMALVDVGKYGPEGNRGDVLFVERAPGTDKTAFEEGLNQLLAYANANNLLTGFTFQEVGQIGVDGAESLNGHVGRTAYALVPPSAGKDKIIFPDIGRQIREFSQATFDHHRSCEAKRGNDALSGENYDGNLVYQDHISDLLEEMQFLRRQYMQMGGKGYPDISSMELRELQRKESNAQKATLVKEDPEEAKKYRGYPEELIGYGNFMQRHKPLIPRLEECLEAEQSEAAGIAR